LTGFVDVISVSFDGFNSKSEAHIRNKQNYEMLVSKVNLMIVMHDQKKLTFSFLNLYGITVLLAKIAIPLFVLFLLTCISYLLVSAFGIDAAVLNVFFSLSLPMIIGLISLPLLWDEVKEHVSLSQLALIPCHHGLSLIIGCCLVATGFLYGIVRVQNSSDYSDIQLGWLFHFFWVALSEEFFVRSFLYEVLRRNLKVGTTIVVSSLIFAFACHTAGDLTVNLLIRFPLGILLGWLRASFGDIYASVGCHYLYNIIVTYSCF
jgi:membrane protease YdiL (CAAX protease family)